MSSNNSNAVIWGNSTPVDESRRQSTNPNNALNGLPNQRPVQLFTLDPSRYVGPDAIPLPTSKTRSFVKQALTETQKRINYCAKFTDCSAFDDPMFTQLCGICTVANDAGAVGVQGLYITPEDRDASVNADGSFRTDAKPSYGTCPYKAFTLTKEQCLATKKTLRCAGKTTFDDPNCAACGTTINYFPADLKTAPAQLLLGGQGDVVVTVDGQTKPLAQGRLDDGLLILLKDLGEGTVLNIRISDSGGIGGLLIGPTTRGPYIVDIAKLIYVDVISGNAPRKHGFIGIGGASAVGANTRVFRMIPAASRQQMTLLLRIPMTFIDLADPAAARCTGPIVRTADSAKQLGMGVCSGAGQEPGQYSLDCIRYIWDSNGCSAAGAGFPKDVKAAARLLWDDQSKARTLAQINETVRDIASIAYSGIYPDGRPARPVEATAARKMCLGAAAPPPPPARPGGVVQTIAPTSLKGMVGGRPSTWRGWIEGAAAAFTQFIEDTTGGLPGMN
jgi:hypothetical protein